MIMTISRAAVLACAVAVSLSAQSAAPAESSQIQIRFASFDPLASAPQIPEALQSAGNQRLRIVQFAGTPTEAGRQAIKAVGGKIIGYLPSNAYVVHLSADQAETVRGAATVRWVGDYHPAFRIDPALIAANRFQQSAIVRYNVVVADKHTDKPGLANKVKAIGGAVTNMHEGGLLMTVALTGPQLLQAVGFDEVLWIDEWTEVGYDMDNARIQGGGNYVESLAGYTGAGVNAHIYEGIEAGHQDFNSPVTVVNSNNTASTHGHCTAGIVFGDGTSNSSVRGMAPDAGKFFTNGTSVSRYTTFGDLVNTHDVSHTTASWGGARTFFYTSTSAAADDMVFDHDLAWTQSQSNAGNQDSRPEAWAKNVFSIGGVDHNNNSNPADDSWQNSNASIGPASDGRIKPTLTAYYDSIGTSDRTGGSGYSSGNWYSNFGGTSGATPIVAGHNVIAIQMFTDEVTSGFGRFGNQLRVVGGTSNQNRALFPSLKALQVVSATQYPFTAASNDNRRVHQGWGFPSLRTMWDMRDKTFIIDETAVITQGTVHSHAIAVGAGEQAFKACLNWAELPANPASAQHLINNLSLRVTAPNGTVYWGNNGLSAGVWSTPGGSEDSVNSLECVFVANPQAGNWNVEVIATAIVQDSHVETPVVDADYGLVVTGGTGTQVQFAQFEEFGAGCESSIVIPEPPCYTWNAAGPLSGTATTLEHAHRVANTGVTQVVGFEFFTRATAGSVTVPAHIYSGPQPSATPLASTTMTIGGAPGFWTATFAAPVTVSGPFFIALDLSGGGVDTGELWSGQQNVAYTRPNPASPWTLTVPRNAWNVLCSPNYKTPALDNTGLPVLGTSYQLDLTEAPPTTFAVLVSGLSDTSWSGGTLPAPLPGAPGCDLLVAPSVLEMHITDGAGATSGSIAVPNSAGLVGTDVFHQWVALDAAANALGLVTSNAGRARIGN